MKTFIVTTRSECITEYTVQADTKEEAEEKYMDGDYINEELTDFFDEDITDVQEVKE